MGYPLALTGIVKGYVLSPDRNIGKFLRGGTINNIICILHKKYSVAKRLLRSICVYYFGNVKISVGSFDVGAQQVLYVFRSL